MIEIEKNKNKLYEELVEDIKLLNLDALHVLKGFVEYVKTQKKTENTNSLMKHFGVLDDESGNEIAEIINNEFNKIEGEW